jgi:hypothetical protein
MKLKNFKTFENLNASTLKVGDKLKCKKTCGDAALFPNDNKINKFFVKDLIYDVESIEDNRVELSIFGTDSKGVDRKIVCMYPVHMNDIDLFFEKV